MSFTGELCGNHGSRAHCRVAGGCDYLHALETVERLVGAGRKADFYGAMVGRCARNGCWVGEVPDGTVQGSAMVLPWGRSAGRQRAERAVGTMELVAFPGSAGIDLVRDEEGNFVERRSINVDRLAPSEPLGYLHRYWRHLRKSTGCEFSDVNTIHLMRAGIIGRLHIVNVSGADPEGFQVELFGYALPLRIGKGRITAPIAIYEKSVLRDYNTVRITGVPRLQRIRIRARNIGYHYTRLILPFMDRSGRVALLAVAIQQELGDGVALGPASLN